MIFQVFIYMRDYYNVRARCVAIFRRNVIPIQGAHFAHHWNGNDVDYVKRLDTGEVMRVGQPAEHEPNSITPSASDKPHSDHRHSQKSYHP